MTRKPLLALLITSLSTACALRHGSSRPKVTNGKRTSQYPAVVRIKNSTSSCTASFIRPNTLLTAAHCVSHRDFPVVIPDLQVASSHIVVHPEYIETKLSTAELEQNKDIAFIFFSDDVGDQTLPFKLDPPNVGDPVQLIGYGNNQYLEGTVSTGSIGVKRLGSNQIAEITETAIILIGQPNANAPGSTSPDGTNSSIGSGDSGGPLLTKAGEVIGVAALIVRNSADALKSFYTSLASQRSFIASTLAANNSVEAAPFLKKCRADINTPSVKTLMERAGNDGSCDTVYAYLATIDSLTLDSGTVVNNEFDLSLISSISWLNKLEITDVKISHFADIGGIKNLSKLTLKNTGITDLSPLSKSYRLSLLNIEEPSTGSLELSTDTLNALPNLAFIKINNKEVTPKRSMLQDVFGGTWSRECTPMRNSNPALYTREKFLYSPGISSFDYVAKIYKDGGCNKPPVVTIKSQYLLQKLVPIVSGSYELDASPSTRLTVHDDSWMSTEVKNGIKGKCKYEVGVEIRSCDINGSFEAFTTVKREGNQLYVAESLKNGIPDGKTATERQTKIDPNPFIKISDAEEYSEMSRF